MILRAIKHQVLLFIILSFFAVYSPASSIDIIDDAGHTVFLQEIPHRVVSLVPSATEIIFALDAGERVVGITHHSSGLKGAGHTAVVGGFLSPSVDRIAALEPDLVIASPLHSEIIGQVGNRCPVLVVQTRQMADACKHIRLMGKLFDKGEAAEKLVESNRRMLDHIAQKVAKIPKEKRKRVMRFMGRNEVMTPGNDSFQNEIIRAAGGIPPDFGRHGSVTAVSQDEFVGFNPQYIYGCGQDRQAMDRLLARDGWNSVDAVANLKTRTFPCGLTCRASSHLGYFVAWLSSFIYSEEFSDISNEVLPRETVNTRPVQIELEYVEKAVVATSVIHDFENKSLIVDFTSPRAVVSTLDGQRDGITTVGNHYSPPPCWALNHSSGLTELKEGILPVIGRETGSSAFLFTGADMDNLAVKKETFKEMIVYALVTAGVRGNAMRMSRDLGNYYEPGTINIIILSNMELTPRAMTRAVISVTEGKTAALQDLDIRSSYLPLTSSATGTGTDNIIVVQGDGRPIDNAGGHCKMGELVARAAYAAVREAIAKQNGIVDKRNIFERLTDRQLSVRQLVDSARGIEEAEKNRFSQAFEQLLIEPSYAGFIETAMALSDGADRGTVNDFGFFEAWCLDVAGRISGQEIDELTPYFADSPFPGPLITALNAVFTGISYTLELKN